MYDHSLLWWFALWGIYLLLPLVPTIVIYWLFPSTAVAVTGPFSSLSVNATGAFAAYFVTVLLGYSLVSDIATSLHRKELGRWVVQGRLVLKDASGNSIEDPRQREQLISQLQVTTMPPFYLVTGDQLVSVETTVSDERRLPTLKYRIPEFGFKDLMPTTDVADWNRQLSTITFRKPIEIQFLGPERGANQVPEPPR